MLNKLKLYTEIKSVLVKADNKDTKPIKIGTYLKSKILLEFENKNKNCLNTKKN